MILDKVVSVIAPFRCIGCDQIGNAICPECSAIIIEMTPSRCYRCHKAATQYQVCADCRKIVRLKHVWISTNYSSIGKELIDEMKFERAGAISQDLARIMAEELPILDEGTVVCHVPTTPNRIRVRGYDQAQLIAKSLAKEKNLICSPIVKRLKNSRQLGSSREKRFQQADEAFEINPKFSVKGKNFLVVDDVTTSGATIEAIAKLLKLHGAKQVDAVVFAQALD